MLSIVRWMSFDEAVFDRTRNATKIQRSAYLSAGSYPVIDQGQGEIAGYTDDGSSAYSGSLPVVLFGDHTRALKFVDYPFAAGADGVKVLEPCSDLDPKFLWYYLRSQPLPNDGYSRHFKHLRNIRVPVPPLVEQRRIVDLLSRAENIVRMRREAEQKAKEIIPALFLDMFGDPGRNPKGWAIRRLDEVADVRDGTHETPKYVPDGIPFITSKHLCGTSINFESAEYISAEDHADYSRRSAVNDGDILFGMIGTIGKATWVRKDREFSIKNVALIKPRSARSAYLWAFLGLDSTVSGLLSGRAKGGNQKFVSLGILRSERVADPPKALQDQFADRVTEALVLETQQSRAIERAKSAFQSLLVGVFSEGRAP